MALDFTTLFTKLGAAFALGESLQVARITTIPNAESDMETALGDYDFATLKVVLNEVDTELASWQTAGSSLISSSAIAVAQRVIVEDVNDDAPLANRSLTTAFDEMYRQFVEQAETLQANTLTVTVTPDGANVGNGTLLVSLKRGDGLVNELAFAETLTAVASSATTWRITGQPAVGISDVAHPAGSSCSRTITAYSASSTQNLVETGDFETSDAEVEQLPSGWLCTVGTPGSDVELTDVEIQVVTLTGGADGGTFALKFTDSGSITYQTNQLTFDATQSQVQTALQALPGLSEAEVTTTGTSPNVSHEILLIGVPNPAALQYVNNLTGGTTPTITITTPTPGSAYVYSGARSLKFVGGAAQTTLLVPITLAAGTQYGLLLQALMVTTPAAGSLEISLVDGVAGSVVLDDQSVANTLVIDCTGLTSSFTGQSAFFRTPTVLPTTTYLQIRLGTALSAGSTLYLDDLTIIACSELYTGGPWVCAFAGSTDWVAGDRSSIVVTNDRASDFQAWLDWTLSLRTKRVQMPTSGSPSISDSLLSGGSS